MFILCFQFKRKKENREGEEEEKRECFQGVRAAGIFLKLVKESRIEIFNDGELYLS